MKKAVITIQHVMTFDRKLIIVTIRNGKKFEDIRKQVLADNPGYIVVKAKIK